MYKNRIRGSLNQFVKFKFVSHEKEILINEETFYWLSSNINIFIINENNSYEGIGLFLIKRSKI